MSGPSAFKKKLEEAKRARAPRKHSYEDTADDVGTEYQRTEADDQLDAALASIEFAEAYNRLIGKMTATAKMEDGNKISCPFPWHKDNNPSAQFNRTKRQFHCHGCERGGDIYDIAAIGLGFDVDNYKAESFREVRERLAESFGFTIRKTMGGEKIVEGPVHSDNDNNDTDDSVHGNRADDLLPGATVTHLHEEDVDIPLPIFDWQLVTESGTYLEKYMRAASVDDIPEMFHFLGGAMLALGMAAGRNKSLEDEPSVKSNLFICLVGESGIGKSKSANFLESVVEKVLPFDYNLPEEVSMSRIQGVASAEALISAFDIDEVDPGNLKPTGQKVPVRGLIEYTEMAALMGRGERMGSILKPTLMDFYDCRSTVETRSQTHGVKRAKRPFASCLTTTQPSSLSKILTGDDAGSGFINRWLFVSGEPKRRHSVNRTRYDVIHPVVALIEIRNWANRDDDEVKWSDKSERAWDEFFHEQVNKDRATSPVLGRIDLLCKKLLLLFSLNEMHKEVQVSSVDKLKLIYPYLIECYGIAASRVGVEIPTEIRNEILRHVENVKYSTNGITLRQLNRLMARKNYSDRLVVQVIENMIKLEMIKPTKSENLRGPKTTRYIRVS